MDMGFIDFTVRLAGARAWFAALIAEVALAPFAVKADTLHATARFIAERRM